MDTRTRHWLSGDDMRLLIDGGGYAAAADAFAEANQVAALQYDALTGKLSGFAAMAGDDATSGDFAAAHDDAATAAVAAHADLVDALATLGRLTDASLANHAAAEARSIIPGRVVYEGGALPDHGYVAVLPSRPPSSLGGDPPSLSGIENWILDQVEGFVWPNADTDRLHDAAHVWRSAAESLDQVPTYCRAAARGLHAQRSPEITLAVAATDDVRATVDALAGEYAVLAGICDDYATGVETQRRLIVDLLVTTVRDAAIVQGIGIVLSSVTAGLTAAGATAINAAKIAAIAPVLLRSIAAIRSLALACASRLRAVLARIGDLARRLDRFKRSPSSTAVATTVNVDHLAGLSTTISHQRQMRHLRGSPQWRGGGYFDDARDAQAVLDSVHAGTAEILGRSKTGDLLVRCDDILGYNNNIRKEYLDQPTHIFAIKGTSSTSVVPVSPLSKAAQ